MSSNASARSQWGAWLLFFAVGGSMWYLRYQAVLPAPYDGWLPMYGPYVAILLHVIITLMAFHDSVFQGILCLLIPFYSMYYIFMISDAFFMRALCAGMLVGIGVDSATFFQKVANDTIETVNAWIAAGGSSPKELPK